VDGMHPADQGLFWSIRAWNIELPRVPAGIKDRVDWWKTLKYLLAVWKRSKVWRRGHPRQLRVDFFPGSIEQTTRMLQNERCRTRRPVLGASLKLKRPSYMTNIMPLAAFRSSIATQTAGCTCCSGLEVRDNLEKVSADGCKDS
jgi:hypothetical protein